MMIMFMLKGPVWAEGQRPEPLKRADALFEQQHWKKAALYRTFWRNREPPKIPGMPHLAGDWAAVAVTHCNIPTIHSKAYTLDLPHYLGDLMERIRKDVNPQQGYYDLYNLSSALLVAHYPEQEPRCKKYLGALVAEWDRPVENDGFHFQFWTRYEKQGNEKNERQHWYVSEKSQEADDGGIAIFEPETKFQPPQRPQIITLARTDDGRMAFCRVNYWSYYYQPASQWSGQQAFVFNDRPGYRPEQTIHVKSWCRTYRIGIYQAPAREPLSIEVNDPTRKGRKSWPSR